MAMQMLPDPGESKTQYPLDSMAVKSPCMELLC